MPSTLCPATLSGLDYTPSGGPHDPWPELFFVILATRDGVLRDTRPAFGTAPGIVLWCECLRRANPGDQFEPKGLSASDPRLADDKWLAQVSAIDHRGRPVIRFWR